MKKVRLITTGGTIASRNDPKTGLAAPTLTGDDLLKAIPKIRDVAKVTVESFSSVPGQNLTLEMLLSLAWHCNDLLSKGEADGIVITQGTNTIEESAYLLDMVIDRPEPVLITGAMRNTSLLSTDGPMNLFNSVLAAASDATRDKGVMVCFNEELHAARDVAKTSPHSTGTFKSPVLGPLGIVTNDRVYMYRTPLLREHIPAKRIKAKVYLIRLVAGDDGSLLQAAIDLGADGLVVELMGGGHMPLACLPALKKALAKGLPVVGTSRTSFGGILHEGIYGFEGGDKHLQELGVIFAGTTGLKARLKLILALSYARSVARAKKYFSNV